MQVPFTEDENQNSKTYVHKLCTIDNNIMYRTNYLPNFFFFERHF